MQRLKIKWDLSIYHYFCCYFQSVHGSIICNPLIPNTKLEFQMNLIICMNTDIRIQTTLYVECIKMT